MGPNISLVHPNRIHKAPRRKTIGKQFHWTAGIVRFYLVIFLNEDMLLLNDDVPNASDRSEVFHGGFSLQPCRLKLPVNPPEVFDAPSRKPPDSVRYKICGCSY
jgi:hypothetical protein